MANFELIKHTLEGSLNQLASARTNQGVWEWFNALYRIVSQNRFTGTAQIYGPKLLASGTNVVETVPVVVFGILVDNSMAAEDAYAYLGNAAITPGTTDTQGYFWAPRATISSYVFANGNVHSTKLEVGTVLGTEAGLEGGTASTTQCTVILVYTK